MFISCFFFCFFFFNDTATTEIYTLSLHDALPISSRRLHPAEPRHRGPREDPAGDRKSTRLNSSHITISYAVFCLKKKNNNNTNLTMITKKHYHKNDNIQHTHI